MTINEGVRHIYKIISECDDMNIDSKIKSSLVSGFVIGYQTGCPDKVSQERCKEICDMVSWSIDSHGGMFRLQENQTINLVPVVEEE